MREYNLFISHSWHYSDYYDTLVSMLRNASYFTFNNFSVSSDHPLTIYNNRYYKSELRNKIEMRMRPCSVVLILAGMYASNSDYIQMEIDVAKALGKPIIAIEPWGAARTSVAVKSAATRIVSWNTASIVNAIKEVC